ncbi:hypothetical protein ACVDG8_018860 [Mesorhizobium sp. ORM8.1]
MVEVKVSFFATDPGQFIAGAHRYLSAARVLRYAEDAEPITDLLKAPVLHLVAHGMELLFKYPILRGGVSQAKVTKEFGHDLHKLWLDHRNENLRLHAGIAAREAWEEARASGLWPNDDFSLDPYEVLQKALINLSYLHGRSSSYALRYTIPGLILAPRPGLLIDAFGQIAESTAKSPSYLD